MQSVRLACWRDHDLMACTLPSLLEAALDAAALAVQVYGITGQAWIIPFKRRAHLIIGARGIVAIAARAGFTVASGAVQEGDEFAYELGSTAFVRHVPDLAATRRRPVVAAWATAHHRDGGAPLVAVVPLAVLLETKARAPGARKPESPWNDTEGPGFAGMCAKTAVRRLLPLLPVEERQAMAVGRAAAGDDGAAPAAHRGPRRVPGGPP